MRARAAELSERLAQENGAERACEQIESTLVEPISRFPVYR